MCTLIPVAILVYMVCGYYLILAPGNLYNALVSADWDKFRTDLINYALWATAVLFMKVLRGVLRESTANFVRKRLTDSLHNLYFGVADYELGYGASPYYRIVAQQTIDNPDQRIVADGRNFSSSLLNIFSGGSSEGDDSGGLLEAVFSIVFYSYKTLLRTGWYGIFVAYAWSFIVSCGSVFVINRTSPAVFKQERLEADFRYGHAELRRNAEEVAFLRGGPFEKRKLTTRLDRAVSNMWVVITRHFFLNLVQYGFSYYISLVMYLAIALAVHTNVFTKTGTSFSSDMTPGEKAQWVAQTGGIFIQLLYAFTMAVQLGTVISAFVTNTNRVGTLIDELGEECTENSSSRCDEDNEPLVRNLASQIDGVILSEVSAGISAHDICFRPNSATKVGPISFSVSKGQWLLIAGPTGSGKSSLLRVLRGLWAPDSGTLEIPAHHDEIVFAPQVPYISPGLCTLRELVLYPQRGTGNPDETKRIASALQAVGWNSDNMRDILDIKEDWSTRLSPGEAKLIAAARVLERRPTYAILDEPTASLDSESEKRVMSALKESGATVLMVGHGQSLPALHDNVIHIKHSP